MADKMTDAEALAVLDKLVALPSVVKNLDGETVTRFDTKAARAHIAARLGGGEAPVAWQRRSSADRYVSKWSEWCPDEHPDDQFPKTTGRWTHEYRALYTTPPARLAATAVWVTEAVVEYIAARNAYEDATRKPNSHAPARQLPHGSPITARWVHARHALEAALANQTKDPDHD